MIESTKYRAEKTVVQQLRQGDRSTMALVYKENYHMVEQFVLNNNGTGEDAKDLYQDAFMVLVEKLNDLDFSLSCLISTYLYSVSRFQWLKKLRKKKSEKIISINDNADYLDNLSDDINDVEFEEKQSEKEKIAISTLKQLGNPCKELLNYFYFHQKTMEFIAEQMNYKSAKAARNQKYKCMERLRKAVALKFNKN